MSPYVAFLRGMNIGGRRIRNEELCAAFETIGFAGVEAFLASGNVVFERDGAGQDEVAAAIEDGLRQVLGYEVPTLLRGAGEVAAIATEGPFRGERGSAGGKPQVVLLARVPSETARAEVLELASEADRLAFDGRELHWLPAAGVSTSELDLRAVEKAIGPTTTRTRNTLERLVAKFGF